MQSSLAEALHGKQVAEKEIKELKDIFKNMQSA